MPDVVARALGSNVAGVSTAAHPGLDARETPMYAMIHSAENVYRQQAAEMTRERERQRRRGDPGRRPRHGAGRLGKLAELLAPFHHSAEHAAGVR
jgi:hypothetical protein